MGSVPRLNFRPNVSLAHEPSGSVTLSMRDRELPLTDLTPAMLEVIDRLVGGATEDELVDLVLDSDGPDAVASCYFLLDGLRRLALIQYCVEGAGTPIAVVEPMTDNFEPGLGTFDAEACYRLSRFAYLRRDGDAMLLETPLAPVRVTLIAPAAVTLIAALAIPRTGAELVAIDPGLGSADAELLLRLLGAASVVESADELNGSTALRQWEFHDLLFHSRSRIGRHDYPFGGIFPFVNEIEPLAAVKARIPGDVVPLSRPNVDVLVNDDVPFSAVVERRRSIRAYGEAISAAQLGSFLYRCARVRNVLRAADGNGLYDVSDRPYPSGGATYDVELYITVAQSADIPHGLYHYAPVDHELERLSDWNDETAALIDYAQAAAGLQEQPQVLITLAARFQRLQWKYRSMAYATTLKNVGVLYQTMYLVATAMGLAPCALGGGDADRFARAAGTSYLEETSVGEFLLGTIGPGPPSAAKGEPI